MKRSFWGAIALVLIASGCDSPAGATLGARPRDRTLDARSSIVQSVKVDQRELARMASRHNAAMRELTSFVLAGHARSWTAEQICRYERSLTKKYAGDQRAEEFFRERRSRSRDLQLLRSLPPDLHRFALANDPLDCDSRSIASKEFGSSMFFVTQEDPIIPLTWEASQLLIGITEHAADEPSPNVYSGRLDTVRAAASSLDSLEQLLVLATAEVADSSYRHWYVALPPMAMAMMDGSEVGECTDSGLEDGSAKRVLESDAKGAGAAILKELLKPTTWSLGWNSAVPLVVGKGLIGGIAGSGIGSLAEVVFHRRPRCH